jgi:hypothetical protein
MDAQREATMGGGSMAAPVPVAAGSGRKGAAVEVAQLGAHDTAPGWTVGRAGRVAALLYGLWLLYLLGLLTVVIPRAGLTVAGAHDPSQALPWVGANRGLFTLLWLPEFLASFALLVVVLALHARGRAAAPGRMAVASACGLLGTALVIGHTLVQNAAIALAGAHEPDRAAAEGAFRAVDAAAGWLALGGFFALGAWMALAGWAALAGGGLPRWAACTGVIAGLIAATAPFAGVPAGALGLLLWHGALAMALRGSRPAARPLHPGPAPA